MIVIGRIFCLSTALVATVMGSLWLEPEFGSGSLQCSKYELPCEDGECLNRILWCNDHTDCSDGSDEKYCKKSTYNNLNPNRCPSSYFRCSNGPCLPLVGRCDGFSDCRDSSDEINCDLKPNNMPLKLLRNRITTPTIVLPHRTQPEESKAARYFALVHSPQNSVQFDHLSFHPADSSSQRQRARSWLFSKKRGDFGWGDDTPRAIMALYLSKDKPRDKTYDHDKLIIKQLEIQLALELAKNGTKLMKLTDLALYINALLVSCKNPRNFYGDDLVRILREGANAAKREKAFVNPSIYLTLCVNNATAFDDAKPLRDIISNRNATTTRLDMHALALLTATCIFRNTGFLPSSVYNHVAMDFIRNVKDHDFPGHVYEAAILVQALQEMKLSLKGLREFILKQQHADGSFGDVLSTYLVLPTLAGRTLLQINEHCGRKNTSDFIPLEVLKNVKSKKMHVQYSLNYGSPPEVTQTIQMHVTEGTNFLDMMRLAQDINPKYSFKLSQHSKVPNVYSIGGIPNDVEKGMYWTLFKASKNNNRTTNDKKWFPYDGNIKKWILADGDKVLFWYRPM